MKAIILHCKPGSRFHLGKHAPDRDSDTALTDTEEIIHSDTLFAALANNWQDSIGNADELVELFNNGQCNISSGFHCIEYQDQFTWFLPKPVSFNLFETSDGSDYKQFQKISYISTGIWQQLAAPGEMTSHADIIIIDKRFALLASELKGLGQLPDKRRTDIIAQLKICQTVTLPKVEVRNTGPDSRIYQFSVTEIASNEKYLPGMQVHYYFVLQTENITATALHKLNLAIQLLQYNGIGAERSTIGCFEAITEHDWECRVAEPHPTWACSIALFNPRAATPVYMGKPMLRGGRRLGMEGKQWLLSVRMLQEGTLVDPTDRGQLVSVRPTAESKPYLRHGLAFTLPVHQNWIP